jgi:hypothetical protein
MMMKDTVIQLVAEPGIIVKPTKIIGTLMYLKPTEGKRLCNNQNGTGKKNPIYIEDKL